MARHIVLTTAIFLIPIIGMDCQVYHDPLPDFLGDENFIPTLWENQPLPPDPWDFDFFGNVSYPLSDNLIKEEEGIMVLDKGNFDTAIQSTPKIIVVFYSPKCERSHTFMPVYKEIGSEFKAKNLAVKLAKINVDTDGHLLRYGAGELPLFVLFKNQLASPQYHGQKKKQPLVQWIEKQINDGLKGLIGYNPYRRRVPESSKKTDPFGPSGSQGRGKGSDTYYISVPSSSYPERDQYYSRPSDPDVRGTGSDPYDKSVPSSSLPEREPYYSRPSDSDDRGKEIDPHDKSRRPAITFPPAATTPVSQISAPSQINPPVAAPTPVYPNPPPSQTSPNVPVSSYPNPPASPQSPAPGPSYPNRPPSQTSPSVSAPNPASSYPNPPPSETRPPVIEVIHIRRDPYDKRHSNYPDREERRDSYRPNRRHSASPDRGGRRDSYDRRGNDYPDRRSDRDSYRRDNDYPGRSSDRDSYRRRDGRSGRHRRGIYLNAEGVGFVSAKGVSTDDRPVVVSTKSVSY